MQEQFQRTQMLLGSEAMERLASSHVLIFGIGGVGGYVVEALARSGLGALTLVDSDTVALSNINRQIIATLSSVGRSKVQVAKERVADINPLCSVETKKLFYLPETKDQFDFSLYDYIVDAVDTVSAKLSIVEEAQKCGVPVISAMGAGNKLNPASFVVADIYSTSVDPLARVMRRECKKRGVKKLKVVYSKEEPIAVESVEESGRKRTPGSIAFSPSVMGLIIASEVVKDLVK